jgi:uroporphyrinogen-III decarboxylase
LISTSMYRDLVLPQHRRYFEALRPGKPRSIHLCGNATRHFRTIRDELGVIEFDTGFPVDFGRLRSELGPDITIHGGVEAALLYGGSPEQVYGRARDILLSGIKEGGKFILREANNLPPGVPEENLAAMYRACLDHGGF